MTYDEARGFIDRHWQKISEIARKKESSWENNLVRLLGSLKSFDLAETRTQICVFTECLKREYEPEQVFVLEDIFEDKKENEILDW